MAPGSEGRSEVNVRLSNVATDTVDRLEGAGLQVKAVHKFLKVVTGDIDPARLEELEGLDEVELVETSREVQALDEEPGKA